MRELIKIYGSKSLVFIDESGFEEIQACIYGWSKRGRKISVERQGKRVRKENFMAGIKKEKDLIAPMVFRGSLNAEGFEGWLLKVTAHRNCVAVLPRSACELSPARKLRQDLRSGFEQA